MATAVPIEAPPFAAKSARQTRRSALAAVLIGAVLLLAGLINVSPASAAAFNACNGVDNTPGLGANCTVTITNNLDLATGVTSSTTVMVVCHGSANTALTCTTTPSSSSELITSVDQCNAAENGGGASLICAVNVVNNITGEATATPATVDQCVGSADGTGVGLCDPLQSTTSATVTQCNGSGNGGGSTVTCTVEPSTITPQMPMLIRQCNDSANGGGSVVLCRTSITTNVLSAAPPETTPAETTPAGTSPPATAPSETAPGGGTIPPIAGGPLPVETTTTAAGFTGGRLPATGTDSKWLGLVGAVLLVSGAGIIVGTRRRRPIN